MKPTEDLIKEHSAIKIMLSIMEKIAADINHNTHLDPDEIEKIIDFLKIFADKCHHGKEETALFPALVDAGIPKENGPVGVMLYEHTIGRTYINDMNNALQDFKSGHNSSSKLIAEAMNNYVNLLQNHIQKEENVLFVMANRVLNEQTQKLISAQFEQIEDEVIGHGVHEYYHNLLGELKSKYLE